MSELFGLVCIFVAILFGPTNCTQVLSSIDQNDLNFSNHSSDDDLNKLLPSTCFSNSTLDCLKSGITKMMARLESRTPLEIIPGLSLTWDLPDGQKLTSADVFNFETLMKAVNTYLGSISLKIQLLDEAVLSKGARSLEQIFNTDNSIEGRKRKDQSGLLGVAMAMKASMLSMVMAGVAAMSGKALMLSMMALAFAAMSALKGGGGGKSTTYEIKHEPAHHGHYKRSLNEQDHYERSAFKGYTKDAEK